MIVNRYSFIFAALIVLAALAFFLLRGGGGGSESLRRWFALLTVAAGLVGAWFIFRPSASTLKEVESVRAQIGAGTPVLLEFQSPY